MDILKKVFPYSFKAKDGVAGLIINILAYALIFLVATIVISICNVIPIVKWFTWIFGMIVNIYVVAGIVISVLDYLKVLK